eukprot:scaffold12319_cov112-Isochrysis_galbana.AAC.1
MHREPHLWNGDTIRSTQRRTANDAVVAIALAVATAHPAPRLVRIILHTSARACSHMKKK